MRRRPKGRGPDGAAAGRPPRSELATRVRQAHVESGHDAADLVLEVPQAHAVRTRSMRALRLRVRRGHRWRLRERAEIAVSRDLGAETTIRAPQAHSPRDRRGSPPCERGYDIRSRTPARERALRAPVPMPVVRPVRLRAVHRVRLRRAIRADVRRDVLVSGVRIPRPFGCRRVSGLRPGFRAVGRSGRLRVRVPAVRGPRRLRCGALLLWRLVRGLISPKYQFREPSKKPFIVPPRRFYRRRTPSEGTQPR